MSIFLVDSYSESNYDGFRYYQYSGCNIKVAHSFTGKSGNLTNIKFYLNKSGSPTGNIAAKLYSHSGTFGTSSIPDTLLATSNIVDIETLSTSFNLIIFDFIGAEQYELVEGVKYCISIEYSGGSSSNYLLTAVTGESPTHSGNSSWMDTDTWYFDTSDLIFYVYAEGEEPPEPSGAVKSIAKPELLKTTKEINGAWTANIQMLPNEFVKAESYIDVGNEQYIIKKPKHIKAGGKTYHDLEALHIGIAELSDLTIDRFSLLKPVSYLLDYILSDCEWIPGTVDIDEIVYVAINRRTTKLEALNLLAERCGGELYFHSQDRIVDLKREIGTHTGLQVRYDKNSDYIEKEEDSYELVTRIYPYGADNFEINSTILDNCEDETDYTPSGAGSTEASDIKQQGAQAIKLISSTLNETFIHDLGAGNVKDLSGHDSLKFKVYSEVDNANGFTFGIGELAYTEITVNTGPAGRPAGTRGSFR